ncbi:MAG: hypothetical protein GX088_07315 [Clostridia bacterium]|nr:hypothetical protein [Clostridia bacterium]
MSTTTKNIPQAAIAVRGILNGSNSFLLFAPSGKQKKFCKKVNSVDRIKGECYVMVKISQGQGLLWKFLSLPLP